MKKIILIIAFSFLLLNLFAQEKNAIITFTKMEHDFGKITQESGFSTVRFELTNTGKAPLIITEVTASCGCTTPDYTKEPIPAGKTGFVSAAYNPMNRPGLFDKTLTVNSNAANGAVTLHIKGEVAEKVKTVNDEYPYEYGNLRINKIFGNFANLYNDEIKTDTISFINVSQKSVKVTVNKAEIPEYLKVELSPENVEPNQKGTIVLTIDGAKVNDWDYVKALFYLYFDGILNSTNRISATAIVVERFDETTLLNPPKIEFESTDFNFEPVVEGAKIEHTFNFKNTGTTDLYIRKTRASCGCTAVSVSENPIKPGQSGIISTIFNTEGKPGTQNKIITVITNDPSNSKILLKLTGEVSKRQE